MFGRFVLNYSRLSLSLFLLVLLSLPAVAEKAIVPPDQDAYVSSELPNANYGTATLLETSGGLGGASDTTRALLRFNVGFLPGDATVQVAYLYIYDQTGENAHEANVHGVTESWTEHGVTWSNQPAHDGTSVSWLDEPDPNGWFYADVTSLVSDWHSGALDNNGILIRYDYELTLTEKRYFRSREYDDYEPYLVVIYDAEADTVDPWLDTYADNQNANTNYGEAADLKVNGTGGNYKRTYIEFQLPSIPADATIEFARLMTYHYSGSGGGGYRCQVHRVTQPWIELLVTWNNQPTWNTTVWGRRGPVGDSFFTGWMDWEITDLVAAWVDGTYDNDGVLIKYPTEVSAGATRVGSFRSSEYGTAAYRPRLEVYYSVIDPITYSLDQSIGGLFESDAVWGDFDGDEDLDLAVCGESDTGRVTKTFENVAGTLTYREDLTGIDGTGSGCLAWGDYDNDGDLDLVVAGMADGSVRIAELYRNDGAGNFTVDASQNLVPVANASAAWGDLDFDGDLDLYLQGYTGTEGVGCLYRNDDGLLWPCDTLLGLWSGSADWGEYDGDDALDLLVTGNSAGGDTTIFYHNAYGTLVNVGNRGLPSVRFSDTQFGDYDVDGDLDVAITGEGGLRYSRIYRNDGWGNFDRAGTMKTIYRSSCALGDHDSDGDMDVGFCGYDGGALHNDLYANTGSGFTSYASFPDVREGSLTWADVDDDGDLDYFVTGADWTPKYAHLYVRNGGVPNAPPAPPSILEGRQYVSAFGSNGDIYLTWDGATDPESPDSSLYYCLRVGTTPGGNEIVSGTYGTPLIGNAGQDTWANLVDMPSQIYYWSVRSIDAGLRASAWAPEQIICPEVFYDLQLQPTDDATVDQFYSTTTFDSWIPQMLHVGDFAGGGDIARAYLMFYIAGSLPPGANILSAHLVLECVSSWCGGPYYVDVWEEGIDTWNEPTITWANAPTLFDPAPSDRVLITGPGVYAWDVTDDVRATVDFDLTLVLRSGSPGEGSTCIAEFWSKDQSSGMPPFLDIQYTLIDTDVADGEEEGDLPSSFRLGSNAPNPFNPTTTIRFDLPEAARVRVSIYDIAGRRVRALTDERYEPGFGHAVVWDGRDDGGRDLPSGVYFYRIVAGDRTEARKMVLVR